MIRLSDLIKGEDSPLKDKHDKKKAPEKEKISLKTIENLRKQGLETTAKEKEKYKKDIGVLYDEAYHFVDDIFSKCKKNLGFTVDKGPEILAKMVESIKESDELYFKTVYKSDLPDNFISHSTNVSIFAIRMGLGFKYSDDELTKLGMAALLHDIGTTRIPEGILTKPGKLTDKELGLIKKHPEHGHKIISEALGREYEWLAEITYQEHEREQGQGYPKGLKGDEIDECAKIIGIVDVYEALTHNRPQRKRILPYNAIRQIIETEKHHFSPKVMKAILSELSIFPLDSFVRLNSNEIGKVIETNKVQPLRPIVKVLLNTKGQKLKEEKIVDLIKSPFLYITESIDEIDA